MSQTFSTPPYLPLPQLRTVLLRQSRLSLAVVQGLVLPVSVAVDSIGQIYVVDEGNPTVLSIFAAGANGNVAPIATITGSLTGLYNPICVRIDTANNIWVCNGADGDGHIATILKFAAGTTGNAAAVNTLSNAALQP